MATILLPLVFSPNFSSQCQLIRGSSGSSRAIKVEQLGQPLGDQSIMRCKNKQLDQ